MFTRQGEVDRLLGCSRPQLRVLTTSRINSAIESSTQLTANSAETNVDVMFRTQFVRRSIHLLIHYSMTRALAAWIKKIQPTSDTHSSSE